MLNSFRANHNISVRELAKRSGVAESTLGRVLRGQAHLSREQAFYVGLALNLGPVEMECLALLVVLAHARRPEFKKHILQKLKRVRSLDPSFDWSDYIKGALHQSRNR